MDIDKYPEYAAIEKHIRNAQVGRAVVIAHAIAGFVIMIRDAIHAPPAPPAILPIDRRRASRADGVRTGSHLAIHR